MKQAYLLVSLILLLSCKKTEKKDPIPNEQPKDIPFGNVVTVTGTVIKDLNMEGAKVYGVYDSAVVKNGSFKVNVPETVEGQLMIVDPSTDKLLAVVKTEKNKPIVITPQAVTTELLDMLPNYIDFTPLQKDSLSSSTFVNSIPYSKLLLVVTNVLNNKGDLYDPSNQELITALINVNSTLTFKNVNKIQHLAKSSNTNNEMNDWLKGSKPEKAFIYNHLLSYAEAQFTIVNDYTSEPIQQFLYEPRSNSPLIVKDNYYKVSINQTSPAVKLKNGLSVATSLVSLFLGKMLSVGTEKNEISVCVTALTTELIVTVNDDVVKFTTGQSGQTLKEVLVGTAKSAGKVFAKTISESKCNKVLVEYFLRASIKRTLLMSNILGQIYSVYESVESTTKLVAGVSALLKPIEIEEVVQIYLGQLVKATIKTEKREDFHRMLKPGEKIFPTIKLVEMSSYDSWDQSGFIVKWFLNEPKGSINLPTSETTSKGEAIVEWTVPNAAGNFTLKAEIKDNEGDHLVGSPILFEVQVAGYTVVGKWKITKEVYIENGQEIIKTNVGTMEFKDNMTGFINREETDGIEVHPFTYSIDASYKIMNLKTESTNVASIISIVELSNTKLVLSSSDGKDFFYLDK